MYYARFIILFLLLSVIVTFYSEFKTVLLITLQHGPRRKFIFHYCRILSLLWKHACAVVYLLTSLSLTSNECTCHNNGELLILKRRE
jgi:hypothetical protein